MIFAVVISLSLLIVLTLFQILLAVGAPLGRFAWGGSHKVLPPKLRVGSIVAIGINLLFAVVVLSRSEVWILIPASPILTVGMWIMTVYAFLSIFPNAISRSKYERLVMTPVSAVLAVCFLIISLN